MTLSRRRQVKNQMGAFWYHPKLTNCLQLFETEMDNFFALFRRYLNDKAKGNAVYAHPLPNNYISTRQLLMIV
jgi:UTP--glucose-1-phosphate uridylyltransferase